MSGQELAKCSISCVLGQDFERDNTLQGGGMVLKFCHNSKSFFSSSIINIILIKVCNLYTKSCTSTLWYSVDMPGTDVVTQYRFDTSIVWYTLVLQTLILKF